VSDPHLDDLWEKVLAAWADDAAHAAFIEHARVTQQLGAAAARYREQTDGGSAYRGDELRATAAKKKLAAITTLAVLELEQRRGALAPELAWQAKLIRAAGAAVLLMLAIFAAVRFLLR
jgi:hypothetical protein